MGKKIKQNISYLIEKGEIEKAETLLKEYKKLVTNDPEAYSINGVIEMVKGNMDKAEQVLIEGLSLDDNDFDLLYNLAYLYQSIDQKELAIKYYRKAMQIAEDKNDEDDLYDRLKELGIQESKQDILNKKHSKQDRILPKEKEESSSCELESYKKLFKGNIKELIEKNLLLEAKKMVKEYEKIVKNDVEIYSIKGVIAMVEGNMDEAEEALKQGLFLERDNFDLNYNLGYLYQTNDEKKLAIHYYKTALMYANTEEDSREVYEILKGLGFKEEKEKIVQNAFHKTSIVILTYNNLEYNKLCIESIRKYTEKDTYEIIVVDNNSTDGTVEWLKEQSDIKLILNKENLGFPKGCNQGIQVAELSNDILLLNNDTIVTPNWLRNLSICLYSSKNVGAVGCVTNSASYYQAIPVKYKDINGMIEFAKSFNISCPEKWEQRVKLVGFCMLIKRNVLNKVGLLDEIFTPGNFEDDDLSFRIQQAGYKLLLCKDTFIHHFGSTSFKENPDKYNNLLKNNAKKFEEKWGFSSIYSTFIRNEIVSLIDEPLEKNMNILEIGCACGPTLLKIKDKYKNTNLYGIELNKNAAEVARLFADVRADNIEGKALDYPEKHFDYIVLADVVERLYQPEQAMKNLLRHLKPNGKLLVSIPNVMHFSVIGSLLNQRWEYKDRGILDKTHVQFFTLKEIKKMVQRLGCKIVKYNVTEVNQTKEDELLLKSLKKIMKDDLFSQLTPYQYILTITK